MKEYIKKAEKRGLEWNLTEKETYHLFLQDCHYCGKLPPITEGKCNGIDRYDNNVGYHLNNVVSACDMCNRMKGQLDFTDFLHMVEHIATYNGIYDGRLYPNLFSFGKRGKYYYYRYDANRKQQRRPNTKNDYSFNLSKHEFDELIKQNCQYCGLKPIRFNEGGLDKVNNQSGGYSIDNNVSCCKICNFIKSDFDVNDFLHKCLEIVLNHRDFEDKLNMDLVMNDIRCIRSQEELKENRSKNATDQANYRTRQREKLGDKEYKAQRQRQQRYNKKTMADKYDYVKLHRHNFSKKILNDARDKIVVIIKNSEIKTQQEIATELNITKKQVFDILSKAKR